MTETVIPSGVVKGPDLCKDSVSFKLMAQRVVKAFGAFFSQADCFVPAAAKGQKSHSVELDSKILLLPLALTVFHHLTACAYVVFLPTLLISS